MRELVYKKSYSEKFGKLLLKAIKKYNMIESGQRIAVGLSGGKDSITLLYLLAWLQKFSHLNFDLSAIHINTFGNSQNQLLQQLCDCLNIKLYIQNLKNTEDLPRKSICSLCARLKRGAMREISERENISAIAFGHHATDIAETLLMNVLINKKLGSFSPIVEVPKSKQKIIRPMIYLTERNIIDLHKEFELPITENKCPYEQKNQRHRYKLLLQNISETLSIKDAELNIVSSLENIDQTNLYSNLII